jgi:hypothetical protein
MLEFFKFQKEVDNGALYPNIHAKGNPRQLTARVSLSPLKTRPSKYEGLHIHFCVASMVTAFWEYLHHQNKKAPAVDQT